MQLKTLSSENKKEVMEIIKEAFAAEPWNDNWDDIDIFNKYITDITENANSLSLGIFDGGILAGLALGRLKHWFYGIEYCIDDLCIKTAYQGKGTGSEFIGLLKEYAEKHDFSKISLKTSKKASAYHFYQKNGFTESEDDVFLK